VTGLFFDEQKPESIIHALQHFSSEHYDSDAIRNHALAFSTYRFKQEITAFIHSKVQGDHYENETR
jgi:hypothetical protein